MEGGSAKTTGSQSRLRNSQKQPLRNPTRAAQPKTEQAQAQPRRTCTACKASKVKCDRASPVCGRCARLKLTCIEQRRAQGRPFKFSGHAVMPPRLDRLPKDLRGDDKLLHEQSAQWSADYLAYAFSNIVKKGDVHRVKTLAILRVWMLFSLYYGVDLTRGFLNIALMLLEASVQDLFKIGSKVADPLVLQEPVKDAPAPADLASAEPVQAILRDEGAATMLCVGSRGGKGVSLCNDLFRKTFFRDEAAAKAAMDECVLPIFKYAKLVAPEDRGEFVDSLARMCFSMQSNTAMPHISHIFRVVDREGSTFLALVRLRSMALGDGDYTADILTIEQAPVSKYVVQLSLEGPQGRGASSARASGSSAAASGSSSSSIIPAAVKSGGRKSSPAPATSSRAGASSGGGKKSPRPTLPPRPRVAIPPPAAAAPKLKLPRPSSVISDATAGSSSSSRRRAGSRSSPAAPRGSPRSVSTSASAARASPMETTTPTPDDDASTATAMSTDPPPFAAPSSPVLHHDNHSHRWGRSAFPPDLAAAQGMDDHRGGGGAAGGLGAMAGLSTSHYILVGNDRGGPCYRPASPPPDRGFSRHGIKRPLPDDSLPSDGLYHLNHHDYQLHRRQLQQQAHMGHLPAAQGMDDDHQRSLLLHQPLTFRSGLTGDHPFDFDNPGLLLASSTLAAAAAASSSAAPAAAATADLARGAGGMSAPSPPPFMTLDAQLLLQQAQPRRGAPGSEAAWHTLGAGMHRDAAAAQQQQQQAPPPPHHHLQHQQAQLSAGLQAALQQQMHQEQLQANSALRRRQEEEQEAAQAVYARYYQQHQQQLQHQPQPQQQQQQHHSVFQHHQPPPSPHQGSQQQQQQPPQPQQPQPQPPQQQGQQQQAQQQQSQHHQQQAHHHQQQHQQHHHQQHQQHPQLRASPVHPYQPQQPQQVAMPHQRYQPSPTAHAYAQQFPHHHHHQQPPPPQYATYASQPAVVPSPSAQQLLHHQRHHASSPLFPGHPTLGLSSANPAPMRAQHGAAAGMPMAGGMGPDPVAAPSDPGLPVCESFVGEWLLDDWINIDASRDGQGGGGAAPGMHR